MKLVSLYEIIVRNFIAENFDGKEKKTQMDHANKCLLKIRICMIFWCSAERMIKIHDIYLLNSKDIEYLQQQQKNIIFMGGFIMETLGFVDEMRNYFY